MTQYRPNDSTLAYNERHSADYAAATAPISMAAFVARFAALLPPSVSVLDVGCGSGRDLRALSTLGCGGLDLSSSLAAQSRPVLRVSGHYRGYACPSLCGSQLCGSLGFGLTPAFTAHRPDPGIGRMPSSACTRWGVFSSMKSGVGEGYDTHGYSYVADKEWASLLREAGFTLRAMELSSSPEATHHRWIASFAQVEH